MIKKLRRKFICITMVLLTLLLVLVLVFIYHSTKRGMEDNAWDRLHHAADQISLTTKPGDELLWDFRSCFMVRQLSNGELMLIGNSTLSSEEPQALRLLLHKAMATGLDQGVLADENLRFLRCDIWRGKCYAFTDMSAERDVLSRMHFTILMILLVGILSFFGISVCLARWAVRPVEQAWEQQRQFVADASHELKTPLTVILTNAELLQAEEYDAQNKARFADSILTMSRQMRGLVEELLDQARVDSTVTKHQKLDYSKLVENAVLPFEPVYFEAGRELRCDIEPGIIVLGKAEHLRRVVEILLDNGCKYSSLGGVVELRLRRNGRGSLLSVSSPGVSLTPQQCQNIFKRFYRMDQARAMNRSYGLGLSIAQGIVEQHRGKIWAQSQDGRNTFFVSLPQ